MQQSEHFWHTEFFTPAQKVRVFDYADIIAVAACIPVSFIRLGNFFNSEIYGRVTDLPWAVTFSESTT